MEVSDPAVLERNQQISEFVNGNDFHIDIPTNERMPIQLGSTSERSRFSLLRNSDHIPDLKGRMTEEVEREARRISMGQYFHSFEDFNRCMDSWGVLNGRTVCRYASKRDFCVRTCRFGRTTRSFSRKKYGNVGVGSGDNNAPATTVKPVLQAHCESKDEIDADEDQQWVFQDGDWTLSSEKENEPSKSQVAHNQQENSGRVHRQPFIVLNQENHNFIMNKHTSSKPTQVAVSQPGRDGPPRTIVYGAKAWLAPRKACKHGRKESPTRACGELTRFLVSEEDGDFDISSGAEVCPFRVRAQREAAFGKIYITVCDLKHTCPQFCHRWRGPTHKSRWLGETLAPRVVRNPKGSVKEMLIGFTVDYKKPSNYKQIWRAKDLVRDWYLGGQRASFHRIPMLLQRLVEIDPSCIVKWCTWDHNDTFKRAFVCPSAMRAALPYCQPMLCLDAAYTKNRKYPTHLFLATTMDGNGKVVILCYAVADRENKENWLWFLELMGEGIV